MGETRHEILVAGNWDEAVEYAKRYPQARMVVDPRNIIGTRITKAHICGSFHYRADAEVVLREIRLRGFAGKPVEIELVTS